MLNMIPKLGVNMVMSNKDFITKTSPHFMLALLTVIFHNIWV